MDVFTATSTAMSTTLATTDAWNSSAVLWLVVVGFFVAFLVSFGMGANDVANAFGSCVGAGVLTLRGACIIATVFELLGASLIGYKVSDTVRKGILDIDVYHGHEEELMLGNLSALGGSALWLLLATFLKMPISGTHSIVGATIGYSLVARGTAGVNWYTLGKIVASWFISPILSGLVSSIIFILIRKFILSKPDPTTVGLASLPFFYSVTLMINVFSIVHDGPSLLYFDHIPIWGAILISIVLGIIVALVVRFFLVPYMRKKIVDTIAMESRCYCLSINGVSSDVEKKQCGYCLNMEKKGCNFVMGRTPTPSPDTSKSVSMDDVAITDETVNTVKKNGVNIAMTELDGKTNIGHKLLYPPKDQIKENGLPSNDSAVPLIQQVPSSAAIDSPDTKYDNTGDDPPEVGQLFSFLQIMTATFGAFAHGGNDVSNAIGPLIALWLIYIEGSVAQKSETPLYLLLYGGFGMSVGLWVWGRRVIQTMGERLTKITPSSGFTIEIGSAMTVLGASKAGLPISTTHCKVGSVVFTGWVRSTKEGVDWKMFRNIVFAWLVTVPVAGALSAGIMYMLEVFALPSLVSV